MSKVKGNDIVISGIRVSSDEGNEKKMLINPPLVKVNIGNKVYDVLLDTGANTSVISDELFQELVKNCKVEHLPVSNVYCSTAVGRKRERVKFQALITAKAEGWNFNFVALVIPRLVREVIIGNDVMYEWKAEIDFGKHEIRIQGEDGTMRIKLLEEIIRKDEGNCEDIHEDKFFVEDISCILGEEVNENDVESEILSVGEEDYDIEYLRSRHEEIASIETRRGVTTKEEQEPSEKQLIDRKINEIVNISLDERRKLRDCLTQNISVFSTKPGLCNKYVHKFHVEGIRPYNHKLRPVPEKLRKPWEN